MSQPLSGIRVVELAEGVAGPYAGKLLADYGADVIKVEPVHGDRARRLGPFPTGAIDSEQSALFLHLNTNKRSVIGAPGDPLVDELLAGADVVIQSTPSPEPADLRRQHPNLVVLSVTSFGLEGPYSGYVGEEIVHYALGGPMSASGHPEREPVKMGGDLGQYQCGTVGAVAALSAVRMAESGGGGSHIDLSNVDTQISSIDRRMTYLLYAAYRGQDVERAGGYSITAFPIGTRPAPDGFVQVSTLINWIPRMLAVVDNPDMAAIYADPGWMLDENVPETADALLLQWTLTRTRQEAMEEAQAGGWPITAMNKPIDLLTDKHFDARGFFVPVEHPVGGKVRQPGPPIRMTDGWDIRRPAPTLGQHTDEVAAEIRATDSPPSATISTAQKTLPLDGIRVLDMTVVWAGPYTTAILGDLGADIVRVDNPTVFPSATRGVLPRPTKEMVAEIGGIFGGYPDADPGDRPWNRMALFNAHARNKRSVTLDLKKASGREAFFSLVEQCDVMIENNSVDLLDKLGIGWDDLHARNPKLILIRMPSTGLDGPYREYLGFGVNFEALCGLGAIRGYQGGDLSENDAVYHMDAASGSAGAFATLAALRRRDETGVGELIELSQAENMMNHIGEFFIDAERTGVEHEPMGNRHQVRAPQGCYPCTGDDAWAVITVGSDEEWGGLGRAAGSPDWASDARFATAAHRRANHDELDELLAAWTSTMPPYEVFERCQAEGVPAAPVLHELESFKDPHLVARQLFKPNGNDETGTHLHPGPLWRWDGPDFQWNPLPVLGGDNEAVFKDLIGMSNDQYAALDADGNLSLDYLGPDGATL
ncbi:MAG: crotonobetainyl-CoA:carnitine CoA-transferase CaiB-like acyl-CoA transferase [Acidimicrobiales bacterium]|jgi:crotonobetainyl-CoA:carnitine CoA-transferase CaiB-like acyl-CoA transferase